MNCETCKTVTLDPDNVDAWNMICAAEKTLFRPGGIDPAGIDLMFRMYGIDAVDAFYTYQKVLAFCDEAIKAAENEKS